MAEYDFHFTAEVMDGIFGEVIEARGAWDTLGERLDNMEQGTGDTYTKTEVDTMLFEKVDKVNGKGLSTNDFTNEYKSQIETNTEGIGAVANRGSKNLLNTSDYIISSGSGVSIADNGDGTFDLSGTPTTTKDYLYTPTNRFNELYGLKRGKEYVISTGDSSGKVQVRINASYDGSSFDFNSPLVSNRTGASTFTIPSNVVGLLIDFRSTASAGNLNGIVLKPMIRDASIEDSTYQPYAPTNRELYEMILALQSGS